VFLEVSSTQFKANPSNIEKIISGNIAPSTADLKGFIGIQFIS
jgi:hypothetical protein